MASGTNSAHTVKAAMMSGCSKEALYFGSQSTMGKKDLSVLLLFWRVSVVVVIDSFLGAGCWGLGAETSL
jgi:hypothetical protein